ncbi:MAG: hypothetical protein U9R25_18915 [Chloroflexota bacterium]|nr:hypothetical protein [Chloroflexota bacterium]
MSEVSEPIAVTLLVIDALESLHIPYVIGGSLASALHGVARATLDSDLVVDLQPGHVKPLVQALQEAFYVDEMAVRQAIERQSSFNLIHLETIFKVDLFIAGQQPFTQAQIRNAQAVVVATDPERTARFSSAEDTILAKLRWYRLGGDSSERQWRDVTGIITAQAARLDWSYLQQGAAELGVADLLVRLQED